MKICILSDSHDQIEPLCAAVADAKQRGAEAVLHCGDIVAPSTLLKIEKYDLPIHAIHGNNTGDLYGLTKLFHQGHHLIHYYGQDIELFMEERKIFLVHYPHYARGMALTGEYNLVCCGHTHHTKIETLTNIRGGQTYLCNPGTVGGIGGLPPTYILGDLVNMRLTILPVPI